MIRKIHDRNFITPDLINSIRVWFRFDQKPSKDHKPLRSIDLNFIHYHVLKWSLMVSEIHRRIIEVDFDIIEMKVHHRTHGFAYLYYWWLGIRWNFDGRDETLLTRKQSGLHSSRNVSLNEYFIEGLDLGSEAEKYHNGYCPYITN